MAKQKQQDKVEKQCPVTLEQFRAQAKPLAVTISGQSAMAMPKEFATGSYGWYANGKMLLDVGGTLVPVQIGVTLTCIGSKPK